MVVGIFGGFEGVIVLGLVCVFRCVWGKGYLSVFCGFVWVLVGGLDEIILGFS